MGLIVAPLTDAILSEVPREHAGSASGLLNTVQQMGNALGLGLVSVVFFGVIDEHVAPSALGAEFVNGFQHALKYVVAVMVAIFGLMFLLPRKPGTGLEGGDGTEGHPSLAGPSTAATSDGTDATNAADDDTRGGRVLVH